MWRRDEERSAVVGGKWFMHLFVAWLSWFNSSLPVSATTACRCTGIIARCGLHCRWSTGTCRFNSVSPKCYLLRFLNKYQLSLIDPRNRIVLCCYKLQRSSVGARRYCQLSWQTTIRDITHHHIAWMSTWCWWPFQRFLRFLIRRR